MTDDVVIRTYPGGTRPGGTKFEAQDIKTELQNLNLQIATLIGLVSDMKKSLERMERQACG